MKLKYLIYAILLLGSTNVSAQKEAYNWLFGEHAGLTWNSTRSYLATGAGGSAAGTARRTLTGLPTVIPSKMVTDEGCFTLSTGSGQLLFYSDGSTIWDRKGNEMPNGKNMAGNWSAAQSGIILPYPGQMNKYIAISIGVNIATPAYSVVDMTLRGAGTVAEPLGDVVSGQKNIQFLGAEGQTGESVTSIIHDNGVDYWVVAPAFGNPTSFLNVWKITSAGPQTTNPVVTKVPKAMFQHSASGYIKFTADGKHFAWANEEDAVVVGNFDASTGQFSNIKVIDKGLDSPYGIEFSPSMKSLYIGGNQTLYVYNLQAILDSPTPNAVPRKVFDIGLNEQGLQLAVDGRIYMTAYEETYLYVITNPDEEDFNKLQIYQLDDFFLGNGPIGFNLSKIGLPSFAASWFRVEPEVAAFSCAGNPAKMSVSVDATPGLTSRLDWNFGDGSPVVSQSFVNGVDTYEQAHVYANQGVYNVTVTPYRINGTAMNNITLNVNIVECAVRTNRMIRTNLLNSDTKSLNR